MTARLCWYSDDFPAGAHEAEDPVAVREVHTDTGTGATLWACRGCVPARLLARLEQEAASDG